MDILNKIIKFSLNHKFVILTAAILLMLAGLYSSQQMDIDVLPDFTAPTVVIMTDAHGMASEEVERLVTFPIETAINGATKVRRVRSSSMYGYSFVWVEFNWGMDVFKARQIVSEKMVAINGSLPQGITPVLAPQSSVMGEILFVGLQSDKTSTMELRNLADWVVKPAILATGGVSQVTVIGGDEKQYQILADPQKMQQYGVTMDELETVGKTFSTNSTGGVIRDYGNEYALRGMARTHDLDEMGNSFIKSNNGRPILVNDVSKVEIGSAVKMGYASQNGKSAIILSISKQPNINTLKVTEQIEKNLENVKRSLPNDVKIDTRIFRQADFIESSVSNVGSALLEGAVCVIIVLFLFLGSFRTTVISVVAIPLSLLGSLVVLYLMGMNINTMTLGGMCIAIGSLVDDAIIDVENVYKRLRQNHREPMENRQSDFTIVFHGSSEIRTSIINATLIIIVAFVPLYFLSGMEGQMLKPLGIAYMVSLMMSLVVAMTVTPVMCQLLLTKDKYLTKNEKDSKLTQFLSEKYFKSLQWGLNHKGAVVIPIVSIFVGAVVLLSTMSLGFLPEFNEGSLTISAVTRPGVSLDVNNRLGNLMEKKLLAIPEVKSTARRTGRGELDEHSQSTNSAEIDVRYDLGERSKETFLADVREALADVPGVVTTVGQPLGHRIDHILSGTKANIAIKVFGSDLSRMYQIGNRIKTEVADVPGLVDVNVEQQTEVPQLQIRANRAMLAQYGITIEKFNRFVNLAFSGEKIADIYDGQRKYDLVVRLNQDFTHHIDGVKNALIDIGDGKKVPLSEVADIVSVGGPNTISRENVQRKLVVSANAAGRDVGSVVKDVQKIVDEKITLPEGYRIEYGGQFESAKSAMQTLIIAVVLALCVIYFLLYCEFQNLSLATLSLVNLPLALIGGVFAIFFTSSVVSIPAIIGFITLFGIATRNGILMISKYQRLETQHTSLRETVLYGSIDRLNPILMTAMTTALALIPLVFNADKPGNEIQSPMAVVILGGLLTSTILNIYVIPIIYEWFKERKMKNETV